jgi:hypothetical protein
MRSVCSSPLGLGRLKRQERSHHAHQSAFGNLVTLASFASYPLISCGSSFVSEGFA